MIAVKPNITISSFKKGNCITLSVPTLFTGSFDSIQAKKTKNKNAILQISVNLEKNKTTFIQLPKLNIAWKKQFANVV